MARNIEQGDYDDGYEWIAVGARVRYVGNDFFVGTLRSLQHSDGTLTVEWDMPYFGIERTPLDRLAPLTY